ncbi:MAG: ribonuclease D [Chloroflexi bacterium]|nr:ribonuclease D [Chloroflexota bacterium]
MDKLPDPLLISTPAQLNDMASELSDVPLIAVDTESNSLFAYQEQVCLIQFSTEQTDCLVDTLALDDISVLGELFNNPKIEKIFHAAEYDLLCLKRDYEFKFSNLFDTMVASRILGREKVGLGNLLAAEYKVKLEKKFQRADWGKRPISSEMLAYARLDTHYLIPLRYKLKEELEDSGYWPIAEEDFTRLSKANGKIPGPVGKNIWRINGVRDLSPQQTVILQELVNYRDTKGQAVKQPVFKVIGDKTLLAIAHEMPREIRHLNTIPGMTSKQIRRHGKNLIAAIKRGLQGEPMHPPRKPDFGDGYSDRLEALRDWRKAKARSLGVESDVVLPRDIMHEIAKQNPDSSKALKLIMATVPWRLGRYMKEIQAVLAKI